jgi:hypothetical protein
MFTFLRKFRDRGSGDDLHVPFSRAAESLVGARGKVFLGAPISKFFLKKFFSDNNNHPSPPRRQLFREKLFPDGYVVIAFQRLYLNFS